MAIVSISEFVDGEFLTMVTKRGIIKRTLLSEFEYQRRGGKIAINLDDDDELIFVRHTKGDESLMIATRDGNAVRFDENNVRAMGRGAHGVRGIRLSGEDFVVGVAVVDEEKKLLTITENGLGKRTSFDDFRLMKNRGGKGVCCHNINEKTGKLASIITVADDDDVMLITNEGTIIRTSVSGINVYSRTATGVIIMRLDEGCFINNITRLEKSEEIEKMSKEIDEEIEAEASVNPEIKKEPEREALDSDGESF